MTGRLLGSKAGLDAFTYHLRVAGLAEPHRAATAGTEHHLRRLFRRLAPAVAGEKSAMEREGCTVGAPCHQRHRRGPDATRGMLQPCMKADGGRRRKKQPAGA